MREKKPSTIAAQIIEQLRLDFCTVITFRLFYAHYDTICSVYELRLTTSNKSVSLSYLFLRFLPLCFLFKENGEDVYSIYYFGQHFIIHGEMDIK